MLTSALLLRKHQHLNDQIVAQFCMIYLGFFVGK